MAPTDDEPSVTSTVTSTKTATVNSEENDLVSRIFLIRHGDRLDYADPSWLEKAKKHGALVTDPPLSPLGHRQAQETADHLITELLRGQMITKILVSPYLRVLQTARPLAEALLADRVPLCIERGLSEAHATPDNVLPSAAERFAYFPQVDPTYESLLRVHVTPGFTCRKTGSPCEAFAGRYVQRMGQLARRLDASVAHGETVVCYSHAASTALVAALLRCDLRDLKFAPCGIFQLERRRRDGPWTLVTEGAVNPHVSENSPTTWPWGFGEKHFQEDAEETNGTPSKPGPYFGSSEGIGLDYFVVET